MRKIWKEDAAECVRQKAIECARGIYFNALTQYPQKKGLWFKAINLEEEYGSKNSVADLIRRAKEATSGVFFYLKYAKNLWKTQKNEAETRHVLWDGFEKHPDSEDIALAIQKFERENKNFKEAERVLTTSLENIQSERVAMQYVQLQRDIGNLPKALDLVSQYLTQYRTFFKLWLIKAQLHQSQGQMEETRKTYEEALTVEELKAQRQVWLNFA